DVHLRAALEPRGVGCDGADPVRPDGQRARERAAGAEHAVEVGRPDELSGEHAFLEVTGRPGEGDGLPGREQTAIDRSADGDERRRVARRRTVTTTDARPVAPALSVTLATSVWIPAASVVVTSDPAPRSP